jgi:hypothetical protein
MFTDTLPFLMALYRDVQGWITFTAVHPDSRHPAPSRHVRAGDENALRETLDLLSTANQAGWGAYLSIATRKADLGRWRRGGQTDLLALPSFFVDIDREPGQALLRLRECALPPSCIIRSGHGLHAHWLLSEPTTAFDQASRALRGLAAHFDGDHTNVAQMLRLPGSINTKPNRQGARCEIIELCPERRYNLLDFPAFMRIPSSTSWTHQRADVAHFPVVNTVLNPALIEAVVDQLIVAYGGYRKPNGYLAALCPCGHGHDHPGQHFNFDANRAIGTCFGRHGRLLLKDLCDWLGIRPSVYGGLFAS